MTLYQSRQHTVKAIQWTGENLDEVKAFLGDLLSEVTPDGSVVFKDNPNASEDVKWVADPKMWIVRNASCYPMFENEFNERYQPIPTENLKGWQALQAMERGECADLEGTILRIRGGVLQEWWPSHKVWAYQAEAVSVNILSKDLLSNNWRIVSDPEKGLNNG